MDVLNDYCILHIFQYFNPKDRLNVSKVCRRWGSLTSTLWKESKLKISDKYDKNNEHLYIEEIQEIIRWCGPSLRDVLLIPIESNKTATVIEIDAFKYSVNDFTTTDALEILSEVAFNISSLYIHYCNNLTILIKKLLNSNKKLNKLEIEGDYNYFDDLVDLECFPESLEQISLSFIYSEYNVLCPSLQRMSKLKKIKLIDGNLITDQLLLTLSTFLIQLQALHLEDDDEEENNISISAITSISKLVNLEELSIKGFVNTIVDRVLMEITSKCRKIRVLALSDCVKITNAGIYHSLSALKDLQLLELKNLSINQLVHQRFSIPLKKLKVYRCKNLTSNAFCDAIEAMPFLTHLEIHSTKPVSETVVYTVIRAAMSRNQNLILTEDINSAEALQVMVYASNENNLFAEKSGQSIFYFQCQPYVKDWLTKVQNHFTNRLPKYQISYKIQQQTEDF